MITELTTEQALALSTALADLARDGTLADTDRTAITMAIEAFDRIVRTMAAQLDAEASTRGLPAEISSAAVVALDTLDHIADGGDRPLRGISDIDLIGTAHAGHVLADLAKRTIDAVLLEWAQRHPAGMVLGHPTLGSLTVDKPNASADRHDISHALELIACRVWGDQNAAVDVVELPEAAKAFVTQAAALFGKAAKVLVGQLDALGIPRSEIITPGIIDTTAAPTASYTPPKD